MIASTALLTDLKRELRDLEDDLRIRAEDQSTDWGTLLREEHRRAQARERTGLAWIEWRDGEVSQAAVAWILTTVFIRFAEDNALFMGANQDGRPVALPWIAAPGDGLERAVENESAFYAAGPTRTTRDWLQDAFRTLATLPAGRPLVDQHHSAVWHAPISASASDALLAFFRRTTPAGALVHDFSDPDLDTRFLGDLYQDLSDYAKKTYALLQTPVFVEEFILDQTLTPAIAEFGLTGLKVIDPACGSGHFLLGAFERLTTKWAETAPGVERGERVQRALNSIHGVDLNPFAIAIARFRLTVAALKAAGLASLVSAPAFKYHLAIGDSLLGGASVNEGFDLGDGDYFEYASEDLLEYAGILEPGQYHVVIANPPYIQPPDASLRDQYRALYSTCHGKYALSVPFMELLFRLAKRPIGGGAGYVGQITSNSFMKREFGKKLIEKFLSGGYTGTSPDYIDLSHIIDTSGAYIPGHGTPTVILIGRPRKPQAETIRAVLGVRGELAQPAVPADGPVWREIVDQLDKPGHEGHFVSVVDAPRTTYAKFPWSLSGGGAGELKERIEAASSVRLSEKVSEIGIMAVVGEEEAFEVATWYDGKTMQIVAGESVRDYSLSGTRRFWPYDSAQRVTSEARGSRWMWPYKQVVAGYLMFGKTRVQRGLEWFEYGMLAKSKLRVPLTISFAFVATHNHFALDRGGHVFGRTAPVIKLPEAATDDDHYDLLSVLNSSTACFWLKQVSHNKGGPGGGSSKDEKWRDFYEFTSTKLDAFPLPGNDLGAYAERLDRLAKEAAELVSAALKTSEPLAIVLRRSGQRWHQLRQMMIAIQEELDWAAYNAYGLTSLEPIPAQEIEQPVAVGERPVEIALARRVAAGDLATRWLDEFASAIFVDVPAFDDPRYMELVERRLSEIEGNTAIRLLESPDFKRKWETVGWDRLVRSGVREAILGRLEVRELWHDVDGRPIVRSVAQLADELRHDERLRELLAIHSSSQDFDLVAEIGRLLDGEAVPAVASLRYKPSGLAKFRAWEETWELQRAEDRGDRVDVPVPPKYKPADFVKTSFWSARGKLDVPKERFIAFPGSRHQEDSTGAYGWAGWDHGERGQAIARFANDISRAGASDEQVIPLVAALIELEPWLRQWHDKIGGAGVSPATAVAGIITSLLARLGLGRDTVGAWRPTTTPRGGQRSA